MFFQEITQVKYWVIFEKEDSMGFRLSGNEIYQTELMMDYF